MNMLAGEREMIQRLENAAIVTVSSPKFYRTEVWTKQQNGYWYEQATPNYATPAASMARRCLLDIQKGYKVVVERA